MYALGRALQGMGAFDLTMKAAWLDLPVFPTGLDDAEGLVEALFATPHTTIYQGYYWQPSTMFPFPWGWQGPEDADSQVGTFLTGPCFPVPCALASGEIGDLGRVSKSLSGDLAQLAQEAVIAWLM